jgi:hypothetical protein
LSAIPKAPRPLCETSESGVFAPTQKAGERFPDFFTSNIRT